MNMLKRLGMVTIGFALLTFYVLFDVKMYTESVVKSKALTSHQIVESKQEEMANQTEPTKFLTDATKFLQNMSTLTYQTPEEFIRSPRYFLEPESALKVLGKAKKHKLKEPRILIFVTSSPGQQTERLIVRSTWGSQLLLGENVKIIFAVGTPLVSSKNKPEPGIDVSSIKLLAKEQELAQDILLATFPDTYENLVYKSFSILHWALKAEADINVDFILKADIDVLIDIAQLVQFTKSVKGQPKHIFGACWKDAPVIRDPKNKWHITAEEYSDKTFPHYCSGTAYLVTADAVSDMVQATQSWKKKYLRLEDVFYTGVIPEQIRVTRKHTGHFNYAPNQDFCHDGQLVPFITSHLGHEPLATAWTRYQFSKRTNCAT